MTIAMVCVAFFFGVFLTVTCFQWRLFCEKILKEVTDHLHDLDLHIEYSLVPFHLWKDRVELDEDAESYLHARKLFRRDYIITFFLLMALLTLGAIEIWG